MSNIFDLLSSIKNEKHVYIQTHDFPDHDSVASAYGFQMLLKNRGINSSLIFNGTIQRDSLKEMIERLKINIKSQTEYPLKHTDKIIIVDGCKGNKNVTDLVGEEIAVIDHHEVAAPDDVKFSDIRPEYGACSTLIHKYYMELDMEPVPSVCTALIIGLLVDTALLTRGVCNEDIEAYSRLYMEADTGFVNKSLRNSIQEKDLKFYREAINNVRIEDRIAFCYFDDGCNQNLMGIIGDFFLSINEVDFVLLCAKNGNVINFSLRSETDKWNAAVIMQSLLKGIGFGGGHSDMAGGIIKDTNLFKTDAFYSKLMGLLQGI
ncbi:MAG: DHH family phosphoesterase [Spirochaetales bacterium]|nr:DHH family phosphoesterase [Spirochaetales bacterium]